MKQTLTFFSLLGLLLISVSSYGYEKRDLLQQTGQSPQKIQEVLVSKSEWIPFPEYHDRGAWQRITGPFIHQILEKGETALSHQWQVVKATDYLAFDRSGDREIMQRPFNANIKALANLVVAELAEGKGRFMDQIANGLWHTCEMTSWALSAHIAVGQKEKTSLPSYKEHVIDLTSGDVASLLAWTHYFLKDELNKVHPMIAQRVADNLQERIMEPYLERSNYWWQAFDATPQTMVNNWNPWCNFNVLTTFLLMEEDQELLSKAVFRTMKSVDSFLNYVKEDGACEEGPSYWGHASGKLYDYLQILSYATGQRLQLFQFPLVKNMGEYISKSYIGDGWVVNFADASARGGGPEGVIFRYGKATDSKDMMSFAAYLNAREKGKKHVFSGRDIFRTLENLKCYPELKSTRADLPVYKNVWYPQTEFCYMRRDNGFFLATKGGHNNESHNHNDIGSFILFYNQQPVFVDAGVGTYTRKTFSSKRYSIWTMQSNYHNLPLINGFSQNPGRKFQAKNVGFNAEKSTFSLDISKAYPSQAGIKKWKRTYKMQNSNKLLISESFEIENPQKPNIIHFLSLRKPDLSENGYLKIHLDEKTVTLKFDPNRFKSAIEPLKVEDPRLVKVWGKQLFRISLNAKDLKSKGNYKYSISTE